MSGDARQTSSKRNVGETPQSRVLTFDLQKSSSRCDHSRRSSRKLARRHTPYQKTPKSRQLIGARSRLVRSPPNDQTESSEDSVVPEYVNKTLRVYKATPLYKFSDDSRTLKQYSRLLSVYIEAETKKGIAVGTDSQVANKVMITHAEGIQSNTEDAKSIQITMKQESTSKNSRSKETKVVLSALLISANIEKSCKEKMDSSFIWLPVMLVKGPTTLTNHLISWLQTEFDTNICPMKFSSYSLCWMVAMWTGYVLDDQKSKWVELLYQVPDRCEGLSSVTYNIHPADCKRLWDSVHDLDSTRFTGDEVTLFMKSLEQHFYSHFKVYLSAMYLNRIGTSSVFAGAEGRIKIFSRKEFIEVLSYLTSLATEEINALMP